ncbi:MAG: hypothetical protein AAB899_01150 [Patescibacteria group bacterium]
MKLGGIEFGAKKPGKAEVQHQGQSEGTEARSEEITKKMLDAFVVATTQNKLSNVLESGEVSSGADGVEPLTFAWRQIGKSGGVFRAFMENKNKLALRNEILGVEVTPQDGIHIFFGPYGPDYNLPLSRGEEAVAKVKGHLERYRYYAPRESAPPSF